MYCRLILLASALVMPLSNFAVAGEGASETDPDTVRCRSVRELGTRIPKRVCKTNQQWAQEQEAARQAMEDRNRSSQCTERC